jgi:hypothetical protein
MPVDVQTPSEAFLNISLKYACVVYETFFLVKGKTSGLGTILLKCCIIRTWELSDIRSKEFCCIRFTAKYVNS